MTKKKVNLEVGQIWHNPEEKQTKVLLAVCPPEKDEDKWFVAFQVKESGCVYNEYLDIHKHILMGQSFCNLENLFEIAK